MEGRPRLGRGHGRAAPRVAPAPRAASLAHATDPSPPLPPPPGHVRGRDRVPAPPRRRARRAGHLPRGRHLALRPGDHRLGPPQAVPRRDRVPAARGARRRVARDGGAGPDRGRGQRHPGAPRALDEGRGPVQDRARPVLDRLVHGGRHRGQQLVGHVLRRVAEHVPHAGRPARSARRRHGARHRRPGLGRGVRALPRHPARGRRGPGQAGAGRPPAGGPHPPQIRDQVHDRLLAQRARRLPRRPPRRDREAPARRVGGHARVRVARDVQHGAGLAAQRCAVVFFLRVIFPPFFFSLPTHTPTPHPSPLQPRRSSCSPTCTARAARRRCCATAPRSTRWRCSTARRCARCVERGGGGWEKGGEKRGARATTDPPSSPPSSL